jgi:hypothetical protein
MEPAATELEQVLGKDVSAGNIVDSYEVKFAPEGVRNKVSIDKDDRDARFAQQGRQSAVDLVTFRYQLIRSEEDPTHPVLDELVAKFFRMLRARICVKLRLARAAPDQTVVALSRQTGKFSANFWKNLRIAKIGHQQRKHTGGPGSIYFYAPRFGEGTRACPALYQPSFNQGL